MPQQFRVLSLQPYFKDGDLGSDKKREEDGKELGHLDVTVMRCFRKKIMLWSPCLIFASLMAGNNNTRNYWPVTDKY